MSEVMLLTLVVMCSLPSFRRAGINFVRGENTVEVTEAQFKQIHGEPRLSIKSVDGELPEEFEEALDLDSQPEPEPLDLSGLDEAQAAIVAAIHAEKLAGNLKLTQNGQPDVAALEAVLSTDDYTASISAKERDDAWAVYKKLTGAE